MGKSKRNKKKRRSGSGSGPTQAAAETGSPQEATPAPDSAGEKKPRSRPRPETTYDWIRENLEAIIVAFILALIIRHFSVEAFEIPTGSMAPTLFGIHSWLDCPNCEKHFNVGLPSDSETGNLTLRYTEVEVYRGNCPRCKLRHVCSFINGRRLRPGRDEFVCEAGNCNNRWRGELEDFHTERVVVAGREIGTLHDDLEFECPLCQFVFHDVLDESNQYGGHKILVNKFAYKVGPARRFDVIVFQKDEEHNYIKRLLGLPGEEVSVRGGDLYVRRPGEEDFHVVRKDRPEVREALWFEIADTGRFEHGYQPVPAWKEDFEKGAGLDGGVDSKYWTWKGEKDQLRWSVNVLQPPGRTAILRFNRKCENFYNYNLLRTQRRMIRRELVGDKKVAFSVTPTKQSGSRGWIGAEIRDGPFTFQMRLPVGSPDPAREATLRRLPTDSEPSSPSPGRAPPDSPEYTALQAHKPVALPLMKQSRVEFENADDRVAVRVNGEEILSLDYTSGSPDLRFEEEQYLQLLASASSAEFESIVVYRDIHYTYAQTGLLYSREASLKIGSRDDESGRDWYFPCGDNSPSSADGRIWGTAPEQNMMGQALLIFWPALPVPDRWQCRFIR